MTERRYRDDEVRKIFKLATSQKSSELRSPAAADGLTLAEIQSIGSEVGLDPEAVARAAGALDMRVQRPRTSLGIPIEVGLMLPLARAVTDHEWEQLVAELRATFRAKGRITTHGNLREWSNGNLSAAIEPTETGYRLRLGTLKGDAIGINAMAATGMAGSAIVLIGLAMSGNLAGEAVLGPALLGAGGLGAFLTNWLRIPRWKRLRAEQMKHIAARLKSIMTAGTETLPQ